MKRGEIWRVALDPTVGHEQTGTRPALILSVDRFNASGADLVVVLPITSKASKHRALPSRIRVTPPEGGLSKESWVICEQPRTVATSRLGRRMGSLRPATMHAVEVVVCFLLGFPSPPG